MTRPAGPRDRGATLVETLVVLLILGVVVTALTTALVTTSRHLRADEDEARGLADVRVVVERLGRDIRDARGVAAGADEHHLVLWIDYDSDYRQQADETVTWELRASDSPGHFDVHRSVPGGVTVREAGTLVSDLAFCYSVSADAAGPGACLPTPVTPAQADAVRLVGTSLAYDAVLSGGTGRRGVEFATRLRNVE